MIFRDCLNYLVVFFLVGLVSCNSDNPSEPKKNDLSGFFVIPGVLSNNAVRSGDTLEIVYGDTLNILRYLQRDENGKEIPLAEKPVFSLSGTDIKIDSSLRVFPQEISVSKGVELPVKVTAKSGNLTSTPFYIVVLPKISSSVDTLIALGKTAYVSTLYQKGRTVKIRTMVVISGKTQPGVLNTDDWSFRQKEIRGTLSDEIGTVYAKIGADKIITRITGIEKVNNTSFSIELK